MNARLDDFYASRGLPAPTLRVDDAALARIRARLQERLAQWDGLPAGDTLELGFSVA